MADKPGIYLDSCDFIDMVKQEVGVTLNADRANDVWHLKQLLQAKRDDEISAFTSTFAIAECTSVDGSVTRRPHLLCKTGAISNGSTESVFGEPTQYMSRQH